MIVTMLLVSVVPTGCGHRAVAPAPRPTTTATSRVIDLEGRPADPLARIDRAVVLLFITNDCPISNSYAPEIHRLCDAYTRQGIAFCLVYADRDLTPAAARQHYHDFAYTCPAVLDLDHQLVTRAGATVTPEAAVFNSQGNLVYRGRIDDLYLDFGKARYTATTHDLRDALDVLAKGQALAPRTTIAVGCHIPM